jgi:hypothetical protein
LTYPERYDILLTEREGNPMKKEKKFDKRIFKKTGDELQAYLAFKRRGSATKSKKGKGSYDRKKFKRGED